MKRIVLVLLLLLLLAGCVSTSLQRDYEKALLRSNFLTTQADIQDKIQKQCEERRRHAVQCRYHCKYGVEWHRSYKSNRPAKSTSKAPDTVFGP